MHEKSPILTATIRPKIGTRYAQRTRKQGGLPAVMYGHGQDPVALTLDAREALRHINKGEKVFQVEIEGKGEKQLVLLKAVQFDYLGTNIVHADLARASMKDRVHSRVSIHLVGEAVGLKVAGAVLIHPVTEVEIECPLESLPDYVEVDVTALDEEHPITAAKVPLPEGAKLISDKHGIVAQIVVQQEVEEPTAEAGDVEAQAAPEVITAKKDEEEAPKADAKKK